MTLSSKIVSIANLVLHCQYCHPLSGCILSSLKGMAKAEILACLRAMDETDLDRIISYHQCCPYQERVMV